MPGILTSQVFLLLSWVGLSLPYLLDIFSQFKHSLLAKFSGSSTIYQRCHSPSQQSQQDDDKSVIYLGDEPNSTIPCDTAAPPRNSLYRFLKRASPHCFVLGFILLFVYLADVEHVFPKSTRTYSRDFFAFLCLGITGSALLTIRRPSPPRPASSSTAAMANAPTDKILPRGMTDEWKGWMQIIFLLYHYFAAKEIYNLIRVLIAGYVWLTGFGNFFYFYRRNDFSLNRLLRMLFRLNFLVVLICMVTGNELMLYYICPMHTYWFLAVYATLGIKSSWNKNPKLLALKLFLYFIINTILFEFGLDFFFQLLGPSSPLPLLSLDNSLHEWRFRAGLDRWACLIGMLCAWGITKFENWIRKVEEKMESNFTNERFVGHLDKLGVAVVAIIVTLLWGKYVLIDLDKFTYNKVHPYTSWIPILSYIFLRNFTPYLRRVSLSLFEWTGRITLETYLLQFHVWLVDDAKSILQLPFIGTEYPLLNFAFVSAIYILLSNELFHITGDLADILFGSRGDSESILGHGKSLIWWVKVVGVVLMMGVVSSIVATSINVMIME